uniref:Uncharacterized protein n=1 Tax=viral metagenome TaxID=1070528 RepID=A0A6M3K5R4_9ZZZZ
MDCSLKKLLPEYHENMKNPKLASVMSTCPILGKQICLWCCLHICDVADPMKRNRALDNFPDLVKVEEESGRAFDSMWETCSRCHVRV